jgi:hypothetical protein
MHQLRSPQLKGKVERSHRSDQEEFYQLLNYVDDQDLNTNYIPALDAWQRLRAYFRYTHGAIQV